VELQAKQLAWPQPGSQRPHRAKLPFGHRLAMLMPMPSPRLEQDIAELHRAEWVAPRLVRLPLATPTLPPATATNHVLLGHRSGLLVDPSAPALTDQSRLAALMTDLQAAGWQFRAILLTHHHRDHAGAAAGLSARLDLPIWAHAATAARLPELTVARPIDDGEVVADDELGPWRALHTPGHAPGHLVLHRPDGALVAGDMVAGEGTILVDPRDDGDMGQYLASLERMRALNPRLLVPAHGPVLRPAEDALRFYLQHRRAREAKVGAALTDAWRPPEDLLPVAYADVARLQWPLALLSLRAHLVHLQQQGLASEQGGRWRRLPSSPD
jgi:glyoxylase-like metal-dependent hydrolase (beta-lactamase superfamily II)